MLKFISFLFFFFLFQYSAYSAQVVMDLSFISVPSSVIPISPIWGGQVLPHVATHLYCAFTGNPSVHVYYGSSNTGVIYQGIYLSSPPNFSQYPDYFFQGGAYTYSSGSIPPDTVQYSEYCTSRSWVDYVSVHRGSFLGFGGRPKGCYVLSEKNYHTIPSNFTQSELEFGYKLVQSKPLALNFNSDPIYYKDSRYLRAFFQAQWVNPQCLLSPTARVSSYSWFTNVFDFFFSFFD